MVGALTTVLKVEKTWAFARSLWECPEVIFAASFIDWGILVAMLYLNFAPTTLSQSLYVFTSAEWRDKNTDKVPTSALYEVTKWPERTIWVH